MQDPIVQQSVAAASLDQAVLVATGDPAERGRRRAGEVVTPLTRIAGLPLVLRTALALQRAGVKELLVLAGAHEASMKTLLREDPRVRLTVRWMPVREFPLEDPRTWEAIGAEIKGACLLLESRTVFSPGLIQRMREEVRGGAPVLLLRGTPEPDGRAGMRGAGADSGWPPGVWGSRDAEEGAVAPPDLLVVPGTLLRQTSTAVQIAGAPPLAALVEQAEAQRAARTIHQPDDRERWCRTVPNGRAVRTVERRLLDFPANSFDGWVDAYVNRVLSKPLTRLFLALRLSPNAITGLSITIGLVAAAGFAAGSYAAGVAGAVLLQLAAVVDCCDGDVARATFAESAFGAQLDILGDNVVHMAVFGGIAWSVYATVGQGPQAWLALALGAAAVAGTACAVVLVRRAERLARDDRAGDPERAARARFLLDHMASRDFTVVILACAVLDLLDWFLVAAAVGVNVFWLAMAWYTRPSRTARA